MNAKSNNASRSIPRIGLMMWLAGCLLSALTGAGAGFAIARSLHNPHPASDNYAETHRGHLSRLDTNASPGRVVFLGSSTFQALDTAAISPLALNLGMGGDTLPRLTTRAQAYGSIAQAGAIVINIGLNDIMNTCRRVEGQALQALFRLIPDDTPLIVLDMQGVSPGRHGARCDGRVANLIADSNIALATQCTQRPKCRVVANPIPADVDALASEQLHEPDGIHLSPSAYAQLKLRLRDALAELAPALAQQAARS